MPVSSDQVRDTWFWQPRHDVEGYDAAEVDDLVRRVAAELDAERPAWPLVENATFRTGKWRRRYDIDAVNWFFGQFLLPQDHIGSAGIGDDPWHDLPVAQLVPALEVRGAPPSPGPGLISSGANFVSECEKAWRDFSHVPGTHLWWGRAGMFRKALCTEDQQILASVWGSSPEIVSAGGRDFIFTSRARYSENPQKTWSSPPSNYWFELADDETGIPILYSSGDGYNFSWSARASIMFHDRRWLRFLVRGTRRANAIMTAVDQAGNRVARYRLADKRNALFGLSNSVEIAVNPGWKLTDELALALVISAKWLQPYFTRPGGGGA